MFFFFFGAGGTASGGGTSVAVGAGGGVGGNGEVSASGAGGGQANDEAAVPHWWQNFASSGSCVPHLGQYFIGLVFDELKSVKNKRKNRGFLVSIQMFLEYFVMFGL